MKDSSRTKQELIEELSILKNKIKKLQFSESDRKQAEEVQRKNEEKYRGLVENISDVIFDVDHQGDGTLFQPDWKGYLGIQSGRCHWEELY
jgi:PAS domain-containing protein